MCCADTEGVGAPWLDEDFFEVIFVDEAIVLSVVRKHLDILRGIVIAYMPFSYRTDVSKL